MRTNSYYFARINNLTIKYIVEREREFSSPAVSRYKFSGALYLGTDHAYVWLSSGGQAGVEAVLQSSYSSDHIFVIQVEGCAKIVLQDAKFTKCYCLSVVISLVSDTEETLVCSFSSTIPSNLTKSGVQCQCVSQ